MFDYLLESSHRDDSIKLSNIGFGEEITQVESVEVHFMHLIQISVPPKKVKPQSNKVLNFYFAVHQ